MGWGGLVSATSGAFLPEHKPHVRTHQGDAAGVCLSVGVSLRVSVCVCVSVCVSLSV